MGTGRRLRDENPGVKLISMQPDSPLHGLEGLKHMATAIVPGIYDPLADENIGVSTEDAYAMRAPARARGRRARRHFQRGGPGCLPARCGTYRGGRGGDRVSRCRRQVPFRALLGGSRGSWTGARGRSGGPGIDAAIREHGRETYPNECCGALIGLGTSVRRTCLALPNTTEEGPRRRFLVRPARLQAGRTRGEPAGRRAARVLSFASRSSGAAVAIRSGPRVADVLVCHRGRGTGAARGDDRVAAQGRSVAIRGGLRRRPRLKADGLWQNKILIPTPLRPYTNKQDSVEADGTVRRSGSCSRT